MIHSVELENKLVRIIISEDGEGICGLVFPPKDANRLEHEADTPLLKEACRQVTEYLDGKRHEFSLPLSMKGTPFQKSVWKALETIPYGKTMTYQEIAVLIGNPKSCRAVGMANHRNPVSIIVPCHRVIGSDGKLTGYGGGLDVKEKLLELERNGMD